MVGLGKVRAGWDEAERCDGAAWLQESPTISAIIPCLNEEETLGICIAKAQAAFETLGIAGEVVVGDNGSDDRSVSIAESMGARVVHQPVKGYGAALQAAIGGARGKYLIMADADDSYDWSNLEPFVEGLSSGADFVIGNRFKGGILPGAMPPLHRYLGNPVLSFIARLFFGVPVRDFHCGMRAFTSEAFQRMQPQTPGMEFATEMIVRAARVGLDIREIPIKLYPDKRSRSPHLRSFQDGWRHLRFILTYAPNWLFFGPGFALFLAGVTLLTLLATGPVSLFGFFMGPHFVALGSLLASMGFSIITMGLLAKVIIWREMPAIDDRLVSWLKQKFALEPPLAIGTLLAGVGLAINVTLLWRWLERSGSMDDTVHMAFLAGTSIALGLSTIFGAFLLRLLLEGSPSPSSPSDDASTQLL